MGITSTNLRIFLGTLLLIVFSLPAAMAQGDEIPIDEKARELFSLGKKYLKTGNHVDAAQTFELALERPFNRLTTACIYYSGLAWFNQGEYGKAKAKFNRLIRDYPKSNYIEDAKFHKALVLMQTDDNSLRELGVDLMLGLSDETEDKDLTEQALNSVRNALFNLYDGKFCEVYYLFASDKHKGLVLEAICHHLSKNDEGDLINTKIDDYMNEGGKPTRFLSAMKRKYGKGTFRETDELKVAVIMDFNLQYADTAQSVPGDCQRAFDLFIGMYMALDSAAAKGYPKKLRIKAIDSRKDPALIENELAKLNDFQPDLILGDISTRSCKPISDWAEQNQVPEIVLLNPSNELIEGKINTFLSHPSILRHGSAMAEFAYNELKYRKVIVFQDWSGMSGAMAKSFSTKFDSLGGMTVLKRVPSTFNDKTTPIPAMVKALKGQSFDGVYVPLSAEENAGMIITKMRDNKIKTRILGTPDWERFNAIDSELKSDFELTYSTYFFDKNDSIEAVLFQEFFIERFGNFPSHNAVEGYDIMRYVLNICRNLTPFEALGDVIRTSEPYRGVHQDFYYAGKQDNQRVSIVLYEDGRIKKINWPADE